MLILLDDGGILRSEASSLSSSCEEYGVAAASYSIACSVEDVAVEAEADVASVVIGVVCLHSWPVGG